MKSLRVRFSLLRWLWFAGLGLGLGTVCGTDGHDNGNSERPRSHRLIVELDSPPLAVDSATQPQLVRRRANALNWRDPALADRVANRRVEQDRVMARLVAVDPGLRRGDYVQANGDRRPLSYVLTFNGFTVETDSDTPLETLRANLAAMPGVKAVHYDYAYTPTMFASLPLIHATSAWAQIAGEITNAGAGIKVASMDGGVHHAGPMFGGAGYTYPPGYPVGGLGETNNNNGKIIASRAYFRDWDPPVDGDEFAWPGPAGTSHGVHTAGTMAGNPVAASYLDGPEYDISGVAPAAWIMSYKVFYGSVDDDGSFYAAEGLAALEDILADGAQVLNNSWGSGPYARDDFDPLGIALRNLAAAGTFISFSAGNDGPERGTLDHAASEYITVASLSTESGGFSAGQLWVDAPGGPTNIPFSIGEFGASWPDHPTTMVYAASALIDPGNACGCSPWPDGAFEGHCALILRGTCDFSAKAYEAQQAGARALIVYNHESGGNSLVTMGAGSQGDLVDIPVAFIGHADGLTLVNWAAGHPDASLSVHFGSSQAIDGTPDIIADSSSRGPGIGNVLKPDIAAPGVNILSQGYGTGAGEAKHLDYGPASGTSMAAPHVAGAAALLRQLHPDWSNADIKSAIMNTARFLDIYIDAGRTQLAQPLDMGAGCLDLARAVDPGLLLDPPSLSFGQIDIGQTPDPIVIQARNVGDTAETYVLQTLCTTGGPGQITAWNALSVTPASLTLSAGQTTTITARLHTASAQPGDLQGFLVFSGAVHRVHMPAWGAVAASQTKDVLLLDFDASSAAGGPADYRPWYTNTLNALGWSYDELDVYQNYVPPVVELLAYRAVILFTGDNGVAYDSMLYESDVTRLVEFANQGGLVMIMGQAAYATIPDAESVFGLFHVADSVSDGAQPASLIQPAGGAPLPAGFLLDPRPMGDSAGNQTSMNAIDMLWDRDYIDYYPYVRWLEYDDQLVAFAHRDQPVLGRAGVSIPARFVVASFGLEGLNDQNPAAATRRNWLQYIWDWAFDEPAVTLSAAPLGNHEFRLTATLSNTAGTAAQTRWRFGNGVGEETIATTVDYTYAASGIYTAQVEVLNSLGNRAVAGLTVTNVVETYTEWADALDIPLDRREYGDDPFSNGVPNLIAYATGIAPDSSGRTPLAIGLSNGLPFLVVPWRTNIETGTAFVAECSTNLADSAAWLADDTLSWQSWPLGSNRVEHRGWVSTNAMPAQKTYRLRFQKGD